MDEQLQKLIAMGLLIIQLNPQAAQLLLLAASQMDPLQLMSAAQQGDKQALQMLAVVMASQAAQSAKFGAKLNYVKYLNGKCPDGYEMKRFRKGGSICKKCMKKAAEGTRFASPVEEFKCGRKMKQKKNK